jgi:hypothetical protein
MAQSRSVCADHLGVKIVGFNDRGEARIVDDRGNLVGFGELRLADAHLTGVERGDRFGLEVVITWTADLADPDDPDFGEIDWDQLLS